MEGLWEGFVSGTACRVELRTERQRIIKGSLSSSAVRIVDVEARGAGVLFDWSIAHETVPH